MRLLEEIYYRLRDLSSSPGERGERSAGYFQSKIRQATADLLRGCSGRLLEIGCGEGLLLSRLAALNPSWELWGVDNWAEIIERGRERMARSGLSSVRLIEASGQKLPFEPGFFDAVVLVNTLVNIRTTREVKAVLFEARRVLRDRGKLIIEFRNSANGLLRWKYRWARLYDKTLREMDHPLSVYSIAEVRRMLTESGFRVGAGRTIGGPWSRWAPVIVWEAERL